MFRIAGNINIENSDIVKGKRCLIKCGPKKNSISFLQYLKPLTQQNSFFNVYITNISMRPLEINSAKIYIYLFD